MDTLAQGQEKPKNSWSPEMERNDRPFQLVDRLKICMISSDPIIRLTNEGEI
jgi:hypothetical protein